jgi:outer membrane receptor protein involved in Fe transport
MTGTAAPPWGCRFNFGPYFNLVPDEKRANLYFTADHDISEHTQIFMEGGYTRARTKRGVSPSFPALSPIIIPPDHVGNTTGAYLRWFGRPLGAAAGGDTQYYESDTMHMVAGFGGDFGAVTDAPMVEDWEWELSGTYSINRFDFGLHDALYDPLQDAINSCAMVAPGSPNTGPDCFNPLTTGPQNSPEVIDKVIGELTSKTDTELTTVGLDFTGPIVELPGGDLALAVGGQMRNEDVARDNDHDANQESYLFLVGGKDFTADRQILAGYGELIVPMFTAFELQAAGRAENYSDAGSTVNPKVGLSWTPYETFTDDPDPNPARVRIRGTFATSFRAPSLLQMYGSQTALENTYDPANTDDPATPEVELPTTGTFIAVTTDGNDQLEPETSTAITVGLEWQPMDGMTIDGDYFNYDYQELIAKQDHQQLVVAEHLAMMGTQVVRDPTTGSIQRINALFQNEDSVKTHGIDFKFVYASDFEASAGTFSFGIDGTYLLGFEIPQTSVADPTLPDMDCDGTSCDVAGLRNNSNFAPALPRLRGSVPLGWEYDMHKVTVSPRFIGGYKNDTDIDMASNTFADVDAWFTLDLQYRIRLEETDDMATSITLGCLNVTGADPPAVSDNFGYDAAVHDPRGRLLYAKLLQEF